MNLAVDSSTSSEQHEAGTAQTARASTTAKYDRKLVAILRTAAAVFAEVGYDPASIRMVAERAGISVAGLYYYVRSKEELLYLIQFHVFDGLVRRFEKDSARLCAKGGTKSRPEARLERFIHNHLDHFLTDMASLTVCTRELGRLNGEYLNQIEALQHVYYSQALEVFEELCSKAGENRISARAATLAMFGSINWISTWYDANNDKSADELAKEFAELFLHGINPVNGLSTTLTTNSHNRGHE